MLLVWIDSPYDWNPVGYCGKTHAGGKGAFVTVTMPPDLDGSVVRSKERSLLELVREERLYGRQTWVFVQMTDKHDVAGHLERLLRMEGLQVKVLRSSVSLAKREAWIAKHAPGTDVMISHPKLVETGLDLFDKGGRHNFPTLVFYEAGYNLFTLRQASRRAWRIGQREDCRVFYLYYEGTMQDRAMTLMGKKLAASEAIAGKFSSEGLASLVGDGDSVKMALAWPRSWTTWTPAASGRR